VRGGRGVGPADRAPRRAPPYRGVRGVRGSTVGGAPRLDDPQLGGVDQLTAQPEQDPRAMDRAKHQVRDRIWALLELERAAKPPGRVVGKIPNFLGAEAAAAQLAALPAWEAAHVLKANPDKAQRPVRARALTEGKVLYMAVPRLADELPFYLLNPEHLIISPGEAATKEGAAKAGRKVAATELPSVDLVVCGSVAVEPPGRSHRQGRRILRPRGRLPRRGWRNSPRHDPGHHGPPPPGGGRAPPGDHPRLPGGPHRHPG
jgi:5-formyltetrahydrofolate cyclo-ligase